MALYVSRAIIAISTISLLACGNTDKPSFSAKEDADLFHQTSDKFGAKMDILWVIDNSGSMATSQQNLADNFNAFINDFATKGYDFRLAVTTTDAYKVNFGQPASVAKFRDGTGSNHSGVFVIDPTTPNLTATFITNILEGTSGSGDERALSSFKAALSSDLNAGFPRSDAFLSIIIISDEDDFSWTGNTLNESYTNPNLYSIQSFVDFLDTLTLSLPGDRRYNVNGINIWDDACKTLLNQSSSGRKIGQRYGQLIDAVGGGGIKASLCDDFSTSLSQIASSIITLSTQFYLTREPIESSIVVIVNDQVVPKVESLPGNGWKYDATNNSIKFYGTAIPPQDSAIQVKFDPKYLTQ